MPTHNDLKETLLIKIPFTGFYESTHAAIIDDELQALFQDDRGETVAFPDDFWDYVQWADVHKAYCSEYVEYFQTWLKDECLIDLPSLKFESLKSPREYNFETDKIYAHITKEDVLKLYELVEWSNLADVIKERFTSYDGFISFYSNDPDEWRIKSVTTWDHNELETLLLACMLGEGKDLSDLGGYDIMENARCNSVISDIVWRNLTPKGQELANAWTAKHRPD